MTHANIDRNNGQFNSRDTLEDDYWLFPKDKDDVVTETREDYASFNEAYAMVAYAGCYLNQNAYPPEGGYPDYTPFQSPWYEGTSQNNTLTEGCPFDDLFDARPANRKGYTHREVLDNTKYDTTPYIYDSLESHCR